jgi:hypothetical protein
MSKGIKPCIECGSIDDIQYHHVVPEVKGGKKTVPLCGEHHSLVHDGKFIGLSSLTKEGQTKKNVENKMSKKKVKMGRQINYTDPQVINVVTLLYFSNKKLTEISKEVGITYTRVLKLKQKKDEGLIDESIINSIKVSIKNNSVVEKKEKIPSVTRKFIIHLLKKGYKNDAIAFIAETSKANVTLVKQVWEKENCK